MDEDPGTADQSGRPPRSADPEPTQAPRSRDVPVEGTRRTRLADERTYLAWWRTGFAAFAVSLGAGKIVPSLTKGPRWPYTVLGAGFAVLGLVLVGYGLMRQRQVEAAITRGDFAPPNQVLIAVLAATSMLLGVVLLVLVVMT